MASLFLKSLLLVLAISYVCSSSFATTIINRFYPQSSNQPIGTNTPVNEQIEETVTTGDNSYLPTVDTDPINQSKSSGMSCLEECYAKLPEHMVHNCDALCREQMKKELEK